MDGQYEVGGYQTPPSDDSAKNKLPIFIGLGCGVLALLSLCIGGGLYMAFSDDEPEDEQIKVVNDKVDQKDQGAVKTNTQRKKPFDVSMDEVFTVGNFKYNVNSIKVSRSIGRWARAAEGARFLMIKFDQTNDSQNAVKVKWHRSHKLITADGKTFTASRVGSDAMLMRKRGMNYREDDVQAGITHQGGVAFEVPLEVAEDPRIIFILRDVNDKKDIRVLLQNPEIAQWILVEQYLRKAMKNPTVANVKEAMGSTKASDTAITNFASSLSQYMDAYKKERSERVTKRRTLRGIEDIHAEQMGDQVIITKLLKKRGKKSERPKVKFVMKDNGSKYELVSIALLYGDN